MHARSVVHLLHTLDPGGCEHMLLSLLPELKRRGWQTEIITLRNGGALAQRFQDAGITVTENIFHGPFDLSGFRRLRQVLQTKRPGLVVAHLLYADLLARASGGVIGGVPVVPMIHSTYRSPALWKARLLERLSGWRLPHCLVVSPAVAEAAVRRGWKRGAPLVVMNPVDVDIFRPADDTARLKKRESLGLDRDAFVIVTTAHLYGYKRHRDLLSAFALLTRDFPETRLLLVGTGPLERTLRRQARTLGISEKVSFLGWRKDGAEILAASDVFVLPSTFEGLSVALLEAMSTALPCVVSDIPENRALIEDRRTGRLFQVGHPSALAKVLAGLIPDADGRLSLGQAARRLVTERHSLGAVAERWEEVYDFLLSPRVL